MDAQRDVYMFYHFPEGGEEFVGEHAAVRVAEGNAVGPGLLGRHERAERILFIVSEPVKEMLGVVDYFVHASFQIRNGLGDHVEVFLLARLDHVFDVKVPGFSENRRDRRPRFYQRLDKYVLRTRVPRPARRPEGGYFCLELPVCHPLIEFIVGFVRRVGPAALYIMEPQVAQPLRNTQLIGQRKIYPYRLIAVTQRGIVN